MSVARAPPVQVFVEAGGAVFLENRVDLGVLHHRLRVAPRQADPLAGLAPRRIHLGPHQVREAISTVFLLLPSTTHF